MTQTFIKKAMAVILFEKCYLDTVMTVSRSDWDKKSLGFWKMSDGPCRGNLDQFAT